MGRPSLLCLYDMQVSFLPIVTGISSPGTADHQAEVFEKAANMVLEIAPDLDQQRPAGQQCSDRVAVDILDVKTCRKCRFGGHFFSRAGAGATAGATGVPSSNPGPA